MSSAIFILLFLFISIPYSLSIGSGPPPGLLKGPGPSNPKPGPSVPKPGHPTPLPRDRDPPPILIPSTNPSLHASRHNRHILTPRSRP
ncbi:hypothetical protein Hanom_Chr08g00691961 [Helianthus anomalus]